MERERTPTSGPSTEALLAPLLRPTDKEAVRFGDRALTYRELAGAARRAGAQMG